MRQLEFPTGLSIGGQAVELQPQSRINRDPPGHRRLRKISSGAVPTALISPDKMKAKDRPCRVTAPACSRELLSNHKLACAIPEDHAFIAARDFPRNQAVLPCDANFRSDHFNLIAGSKAQVLAGDDPHRSQVH